MSRAITPMSEPARKLVLVADDEPAIQTLIERVLIELDLVPVLVGDGAAAIAAVETHHRELVCAILDIGMPGANGVDAAHVIQRIAPHVAIMLMSGAVPANCAGHIARLRLAGMLHKPFLLTTLRELILHAVDDGRTLERNVDLQATLSSIYE